MAATKRQQRFDLSGTWSMKETEGIDGFLADLDMSERSPVPSPARWPLGAD